MQTNIPATKAKNNFGALIRRVYTTGDHVIVEKDGIPVVIITPVDASDLRKKTQERTVPSPSSDGKHLPHSDP